MIIRCPNCNKQFKINPSLIPDNGRDLKCGSCDHVWFYKIEDKNLELLTWVWHINHTNVWFNSTEWEISTLCFGV